MKERLKGNKSVGKERGGGEVLYMPGTLQWLEKESEIMKRRDGERNSDRG